MTSPTIELSRADALRIRNYCRKNKCDWFLAKDQGAYVGAARGPIFYFAGCDPSKDEDWYDTARRMFGGDDFGDHLPMDILETVRSDARITKLTLKVTKTRIVAEYELVWVQT